MKRMRVLLTVVLVLASGGVFADGPESGFVTAVDGVKLHYLILGEGTPIVLLHGYYGSAEGNWFLNGVAQALAKTNKVVALDARGHGESDKPTDAASYGPRMWQDVIRVMNELGIDRAHVHGYSMGGSTVTQLITHYPNRFITASYGGSGIPEVDEEWKAKVPADSEERDPQEAEVMQTLLGQDGLNSEALNAVRQNAPWSGPEGGMIDLSTITIPVLAMNGEFDSPNAKTHRMERELANFKNVVLPGKSHLTAIVGEYMPQAYVDELTAFVTANNPE